MNLGVFPSGQWGQTVNLLLFSFGGSNPPAPTKKSSVVITLDFCFTWNLEFHYLGWIRTASTRRTVRRGKKPLRGFFRCAACAIHPRPPKKTSVENTLVFCFARYLKSHPRGWIRTAAALSQKTAQKQPSGLFLAARLATSTRAHQKSSTHERAKTQQDGCGKRKKHVNPQRINVQFWSEQRDLNPRPLRPERSALPTALCPENTAAFRLRSGWG